MSRTLLILIVGITAALFFAVVGAALGFGYFTMSARATTTTPAPTVLASTAAPTGLPTSSATVTVTAEATEVGAIAPTSAAATPQPTNAVPATAVPVVATSVQYVQALTDVNIRSGPGTGYNVVGWVAAGQTAKVTGTSSDNGWWRVVCPDGTTGSCWVTAGRAYTQAAGAPAGRPTATAAAACTNAAAFVADVTVADNSQVVAGSTFVKTWRIRNSGSCTWDGRYHLVHAGGPLLGAVVESLQMPATVAPGQSVDLSLTMQAPVTPGSYQSDWKVQTPGGSHFGVGSGNVPLWVKINVVAGGQPADTTISGLVYQDINQNGVYNNGEPLVAGRQVQLVPGTACHVTGNAVAVTHSGSDGRYTLSGSFSGSFCLGVVGNGGLDDVAAVTVALGQALADINLKSAVPNMSISGFVWHDYCLPNHSDNGFVGNCVTDNSGNIIADGMIQPTETYIAGVTVLLRLGACSSDNAVPVSAVTDSSGRYTFGNLTPGTYCVYINATAPENIELLLPGGWTFPFNGIWYHEITLQAGSSAYPVNFGWDYQFR